MIFYQLEWTSLTGEIKGLMMKEQLKRLGMTQKQLAEDLGYSQEQVSRWKVPPIHVSVYLDLKEEFREVKKREEEISNTLQSIRELISPKGELR